MSYITTVTGIHFYPLNPNPKDIDIEDIAHALSLICRANPRERAFPALLLRRPALYCMCRGGDRARVFPGSDSRLSAARRERGVSVRCDAPCQETYPAVSSSGGKAAGSNLEAVHRQGINRHREKPNL